MSMEQQSFEHHTQHDKFLYTLTLVVILLGVALSILAKQINTVVPLNGLQFVMPILVTLFLIALMVKMRSYATKLQDRIIRQEVQFRYFVSTGSILPDTVTKKQLIGLRFAGDDEFVALAQQVISHPERTATDIKKHVKNWKSDFDRV